jgi:hypothetical protein
LIDDQVGAHTLCGGQHRVVPVRVGGVDRGIRPEFVQTGTSRRPGSNNASPARSWPVETTALCMVSSATGIVAACSKLMLFAGIGTQRP